MTLKMKGSAKIQNKATFAAALAPIVALSPTPSFAPRADLSKSRNQNGAASARYRGPNSHEPSVKYASRTASNAAVETAAAARSGSSRRSRSAHRNAGERRKTLTPFTSTSGNGPTKDGSFRKYLKKFAGMLTGLKTP